MYKYLSAALILFLLFFSSCQSKRAYIEQQAQRAMSAHYSSKKHEMRAVWLPTIFRGEYATMTSAQKGSYLKQRLDHLAAIGFNAVIFQIRPESDSWYPSEIEPWSRFVAGTQGTPPDGGWDPLAFLVEECHRRCLELHVWINPYRAATNAQAKLDSKHPYHRHPEWFVRYNGQLLYNPALQSCRDHICDVIYDVITRYDIDAIHMDDYFYPYPAPGQIFPDNAYFERDPRGFTNIGDWRRDNVNLLIAQIRATIDATKPYVRFGISPFGIYRNKKSHAKGSRTNGLQNYDDLYADVLLWDKKGWVDYIMPQLYWEMGHKSADYTELAFWWRKNISKAHYYIGQSVERTMKAKQLHPKLIIAARTSLGNAMWPVEEITKNTGGVAQQLQEKYWSAPALLPPYSRQSPYPAPVPVEGLRISHESDGRYLVWDTTPYQDGAAIKYYVVYAYDSSVKGDGTKGEDIVAITQKPYYRLPKIDGHTKVRYYVTQINRYNQESPLSAPLRATI